MFRLAQSPLTIQQFFSESWTCYRKLFFRLFLLSVPLAFITILPSFFFEEFNSFEVMKVLKFAEKVPFVALIFLIYVAFCYGVMLHRIDRYFKKGSFSWIHDVRFSFKKLPLSSTAFVISSLLVLAGYILLFVPGIILNVILTFYMPIVLLRNVNLVTGFKLNFDLVWPHWWRTAVILGLLSVLLFFLMYAVNFINEHWLDSLWHFKDANGYKVWVTYHISRMLLTAFFLPYNCIVLYLLLHDLSLRSKKPIKKVRSYQNEYTGQRKTA